MSDDLFDLEVYQDAMRKKCKADLYFFCKAVLNFKDVNWHTHGDMIKALEAPTKRKLVVMPRGTLKSSVGVVAYSMWLLINNPNLRIMIDSEVYKNSKNFIREIKAICASKTFIELFNNWEGPTWTEGELIISARTRMIKEPSIVAAGISTIKVGQHYDVILCDDLNSNNNSLTPEGCEKVWAHYQMLTSILEPDGIISITATRYAMGDVPGKVLELNEQLPDGLLLG